MDIEKGLFFIGKQAKGLSLAFLRPAMQTATCQEEIPSARQVQQLTRAQGEEGTVGGFIQLGPVASFSFVSKSGYPDLAKVSPVWAVSEPRETSLRSV